MAQPPDDRRPLPWETPREPDAPPPPIEPSPTGPVPDDPTAPGAPSEVPDDAPTVVTATPGDPVTPASGADQPAAPGAPAVDEPSAAPVSPLLSWTPSGTAAVGAATTPDAASAPVASPDPTAGSAPVVGWQAPGAPAPAAGVDGYVTAGVGSRLVAYFFDILLCGLLLVTVNVVIILVAPAVADDSLTINLLTSILSIGVTFLYFVGLWTSGRGATLGMRLLALRIVAAPGGRPLAITPAIIRWAAFGYPLAITAVSPVLSNITSLALLVWTIALLLTTATSDTKQGLHDRWAGSAIIRRIGASDTPAVIGCILVAVLLLGLFIILPILFLTSIDPDVLQEILSQVGESI